MPRSMQTSVMKQDPDIIDDRKLTEIIDRQLVIGDYKSALFWASKRLALFKSQDYAYDGSVGQSPVELARFLKILSAASEWHSVTTMITGVNMQLRHIVFTYYYINAMYQLGKYETIAAMPIGHLIDIEGHPFLTSDIPPTLFTTTVRPIDETLELALKEIEQSEQLIPRLLYTMSQTYDRLQNRPAAKLCIDACIKMAPFFVESIEFAIEKHLVTAAQVREHLNNATVNEEDQVLMDVILVMLDAYDHYPEHHSDLRLVLPERILSGDVSNSYARAVLFYSNGYVENAHDLTSRIIKEFGVSHKSLHLHLACCVELRKITELYEISHSLATIRAEDDRTYYAVGCYYFSARQYQQSRDFFHKCIREDQNEGAYWIAYGHALAMLGENEQAMHCYMRSTRYLENYVEPLIYMGIQYTHSNSLVQAVHAFNNAKEIIDKPNPLVYHEMATVLCMQGKYTEAFDNFFTALQLLCHNTDEKPSFSILINENLDCYWSPLIFNMGFALFKAKKYCRAITCYTRVLILGFETSETWAHIGYCYMATGRPHQAVVALGNALAKEPSFTMAKKAYDHATTIISMMPSHLDDVDDFNVDELIANLPPYTPKRLDNRPNIGAFLLGETVRETSAQTADEIFVKHRTGRDKKKNFSSPITPVPITGVAASTRSRTHAAAARRDFTLEELRDADGEASSPEPGPSASGLTSHRIARSSPLPGPSTRQSRALTPYAQQAARNISESGNASIRRRPGSPSDPLTGLLNVSTDRPPPMMEVEDPNQLMSDWLMQDIHFDTVRIEDDVLTELRPPPVPRRPDYQEADLLPTRATLSREPLPLRHVYRQR